MTPLRQTLVCALLLAAVSCASEPAVLAFSMCRQEHPPAPLNSNDWTVMFVVQDCEADSGACQARDTTCSASLPCTSQEASCTGSASDRVCDLQQWMGADAAKCIALAQGLAPGIADLDATLGYDNQCRRVVWRVENKLWEDKSFGYKWGGNGWSIDAVSGDVCDKADFETILN